MMAVTYRCNADCPYCYAKNSRRIFKKDMSFIDFLDITNKYIKEGGKNINLIGGEPTIWKNINYAIIYCKLRGVTTTLITNGLKISKAKPDRVMMNVSHYLDPKTQKLFLSSIKYYSKNKIPITLRYNISLETKQAEIEKVKNLAITFKANDIDLDPIVPFEVEKEMGEKIFKTASFFISFGVKCRLGNPIPPCIFSDNQREYLKKNAKLFFRCNAGEYMLINPDGKTISPCTKMFLPKDISELQGSFSNVSNVYKEDLEKIKNKVLQKCLDCDYFKEKKCFGGCMAPRVW